MSPQEAENGVAERDLILTRLIDAPPGAVYRAWTEPALLCRWFAPAPYSTPEAVLDVRPGGGCRVVMRSPDGHDMPNDGVYLEVVPNRRIVMTDAYTAGWVPSAKPFMTLIATFEEHGGKTRYTALVRHWTLEDRETHLRMGFREGWGKCADQLADVARSLDMGLAA